MDEVMAQYIVRVVRDKYAFQVQVVIHDNEIVAEGKWRPVSPYGHPLYAGLYKQTIEAIKADGNS